MSTQSYSQKSGRGRILVGLSGGVHSAVAGHLLKAQGFELVCAYLDLGSALTSGNSCCSQSGHEEAERIATKLGASLHVVDVRQEFEEHVMEPLLHETLQGRSPHPCVHSACSVKIPALLKKAKELNCEQVVTGHGARIQKDPSLKTVRLFKNSDASRDQSFLLFGLKQAELSQLQFPLGSLPSSMVEKLAGEFSLSGISKRDPGGICFVGTAEYAGFFESKVPVSLRPKGVVKTHENQLLGEHTGIHLHRVGMRGSLEFSVEAAGEFVVIEKDPASHSLLVGPPSHLLKKELRAYRANWLHPMNRLRGLRCEARVLATGTCASCLVTFFENDAVHVEFDDFFGPVLPGQPIVFYQDEEVLGGAWVQK